MTTEKSYFEELEDIYGRLTFGDALKAYREVENNTQSDFARRLDLSVENICALEEERIIPSLSSAAIIAEKLDLPKNLFIEFALRDATIERERILYQSITDSIKRLGYDVEFKRVA